MPERAALAASKKKAEKVGEFADFVKYFKVIVPLNNEEGIIKDVQRSERTIEKSF